MISTSLRRVAVLSVLTLFVMGCGPGEAELYMAPDGAAPGDLAGDAGDVGDGATTKPPPDAQADAGGTTFDSSNDAAVPDTFEITNIDSGETLNYPLALLVGTVDSTASEVVVTGLNAERSWPLVDGQFKALVRLEEGSQTIRLQAGQQTSSIDLSYTRQTNSRFVRLVYLVAADGDGSFQAPGGEPNDIESAHARISLGAELMQTFVAESMQSEGYGRRTFRINRDADARPIVTTVTSDLTMSEAHAMSGGELYSHFYGELGSSILADSSKDIAFMSFSRYDGATGELKAHTALGGGRLGLFGTTALHTWAEGLDELTAAMTDETMVDTSSLHDDSSSRGTYWANYATTLGASLHEVGHAMSLPHPEFTYRHIMSRGFDHINRMFMVTEPPSASSDGYSPIPENAIPGWYNGNSARLRYHRWFEMEARVHDSDEPPLFDVQTGSVEVKSVNGLRQVAYKLDGTILHYDAWHNAPAERYVIDLTQLQSEIGSGDLEIKAIDDQGNIGSINNITL